MRRRDWFSAGEVTRIFLHTLNIFVILENGIYSRAVEDRRHLVAALAGAELNGSVVFRGQRRSSIELSFMLGVKDHIVHSPVIKYR